jgi:hypothetical protein
MNWRAGLSNPVGLTPLVASAGLAAGALVVPALGRWLPHAPWLLAWGLVATVAAAAVVAWPRAEPSEVRRVRATRDAIAERLRSRSEADGASAQVARLLADGLRTLDRDVLPAFAELVAAHQELTAHLGRYERGELARPDQSVLAQLEEIARHQREVVDAAVRQVANADAALVALAHQSSQSIVAEQVDEWATGLVTLQGSLREVLRRGEDLARLGAA